MAMNSYPKQPQKTPKKSKKIEKRRKTERKVEKKVQKKKVEEPKAKTVVKLEEISSKKESLIQ